MALRAPLVRWRPIATTGLDEVRRTPVISVALFPGYFLKSRERVASFPGSHALERKHLINYKKKKHKKQKNICDGDVI